MNIDYAFSPAINKPGHCTCKGVARKVMPLILLLLIAAEQQSGKMASDVKAD